ncbi:DUF2927 domain-containing protein [Aeromonas allosaccharophila]|uniref:Uncharacterized protein n=1 Tax=Aeromonas veronii TaxID=654 RepID=A0A6S5Z1Z1_AERVE|nr:MULTISPECIES: DUF2927 domain-containing protein [Aeromonas]BBR39490.1 hypothetical protein WP3W19E03_20150 [Aeromonas veronii]BBU04909.1 hypothetical protein WP9W18E04_22480 [Aeromonas veronii]
MPFTAISFCATRFIATLVMTSLGRADYPRRASRGLLALLLLLAGQSARADARWQSDSYLTESFMAIAMEREYGEARQTRFARWQQPIRLQLINESGDKPLQADVVKVQAAHLARITGHSISMVAAKPNLTLIMTDYSKMKSWANRTMGGDPSVGMALKEGLCLANFATNAKHEISRATIIIPVDYSRAKGRFLDCVVEEFTQVMGLPNDSDKVFPSIFNDNSIDSFLTGLDYVLLKLAYHPALKAGMSSDEIRAALPLAIKELRAKGEISEANRRVQQQSLKSWAGL